MDVRDTTRTAVFPGSFDPFTAGHLDVLKSAAELFGRVIVAVGYNSSKKGFLEPDARVKLIRDAVKDIPGVEVCKYRKLTVELCRDLGAGYIVRGLRTTTDFEFESVVAQANRKIAPEIMTVFIPATGENSFVSSTVVRDIVMNGGDASEFLPEGIDLSAYMEK